MTTKSYLVTLSIFTLNVLHCRGSDFVTLQCPLGWVGSGQSWYSPVLSYESNNVSQSRDNLVGTKFDYSYLITLNVDNYKPTLFAVCLICANAVRPDVEVEICTSNSNIQHHKNLHYETKYCQYNETIERYETYFGTMVWCSPEPVCAVQVPLKEINIFKTLGNIKPVSCGDEDQNENRFQCPEGLILEGIETRNSKCNGSSSCLVCTSLFQKHSVCFTDGCPKESSPVNFKSLASDNSTCMIGQGTVHSKSNPRKCLNDSSVKDKLFCGINLPNVTTSFQQINASMMVECPDNNDVEENTISTLHIILIIFIILILCLIVVTSILLVTIWKIRRQQKMKRIADTYIYTVNPNFDEEPKPESSAKPTKENVTLTN